MEDQEGNGDGEMKEEPKLQKTEDQAFTIR